jgi:hypothetical protein
MAKGQQKSGREAKKPKQDKTKGGGAKSAYSVSMAEKGPAPPVGKKK